MLLIFTDIKFSLCSYNLIYHRIEAIIHLITLFVIFLFLFDTFLFSYGLLGGLFNEIKTFLIMFPIYFVGSIAFNAWTIV